jgi:hypothetical protein
VAGRYEEANYSSLRITRSILATRELERFRAKVGDIATQFFEPKGATSVHTRESLERQLKPGRGQIIHGVGIAALDIYDSRSLEVSLFERQALVNDGLGRVFSRAKERLTAPTYPSRTRDPETQLHRTRPNPMFDHLRVAASNFKIDDTDNIRVSAVDLVALPVDAGQDSQEYGLSFDLGRNETKYLLSEADIIYNAVRRFGAGQQIINSAGPEPLQAPFMNLPVDADPAAVKDFIESVRDDSMPVDLWLGRQLWHANEPVVLIN